MAEQPPCSPPFVPYDAHFPRVQKSRLSLYDYVVGRERLEQPGSYALNLGAWMQFALEAFPAMYPGYRVPTATEPKEEHLLELFLRACYHKRFMVSRTTFRAEDDRGMQRIMPAWAVRWMQMWSALPAGLPVGKEEVLSLLDCLWNSHLDARGVLDTHLDQYVYGRIYQKREEER